MNKERILALADLIEQQPHASPDAISGFNMRLLRHPCGTPSCIAGWVAWEAYGRPEHTERDGASWGRGPWGLEGEAARYLGLPAECFDEDSIGPRYGDPAYALFYPPDDVDYGGVSPAQAAKVMRHLAETGVVDWSIIAEAA